MSLLNLCKQIHDKLFNFHYSVERKGKKLQKFEYLKNEKSFLDEIKNIGHSF